MNKSQQKAIDEFNLNGYVCIDACRRSGKTTMLHKIIQDKKGKVGVFTLNYQMFKMMYEKQFGDKVRYQDDNCSLIIGDEVLLLPKVGKKIACAGTFRTIGRFDFGDTKKYLPKEDMKQLKKEMTEKAYYQEFGKYDI